METSQPSKGEEEFIDIVVSPSPNLDSSLQSREFEFQMCTNNSLEKEAISPSPADELFYKGKLLPLHLPPRLQMVQKILLQNHAFEEVESGTPIVSANTPQESCSVSPTDSCRASFELNPDEYFFRWSTGLSAFTGSGTCEGTKKPWSKKIRLIKQSVKSSRAYVKSLFTRPACTVEGGGGGEEAMNVSKAKEYVNKYMKLVKKNSLGQMENMDDSIGFTCHRLSFSGVLKRHSTSKCLSSSSTTTTSSNCSCSSSSFSLKSTNGFYEIDLLKKSVSANPEAESSVEGAIAHCKKSQQKQNTSK